MGTLLDKFFCVDLTYQTYKELINFWEVKTPYISYNQALMFVSNAASYARLLLSSYSAQIARVNEMILDLEDTQKKEEYNNRISSYMDNVPAFSKITAKVPLTPQEIKQKVKNALAHAEYNLIYDNNDKNDILIYIEINTDYIYGKIPFLEIDELWKFYTTISDELETSNVSYTGILDLFYMESNNVNLLKSAINKIGIRTLDGVDVINNNQTFYEPYYDPTATPLNDKQKELIFNYIRYVGLANWVLLSPGDRACIFARHLKFMINSKNNFRNSSAIISNTLDYCLFHSKGEVSEEDIYLMSFESPCIYAGMILDLGFLTLNYIKEVLHKEELPNFNYRNINLNSIKYIPSDCVKYVSKEEEQKKLGTIIGELENRKNKLLLTTKKKKEDIDNIKKVSSLSDEKKEKIVSDKQKGLDEATSRLDEVTILINQLKEKLDNATDYYDANDFFKHLRNSISHGFYEVDYSEALKRKDLTKIVFIFSDYEIDANDRKNRKEVFRASITASKLIDLFEQLYQRLQQSYDTFDIYENKTMLYDDMRRDKNMSKERAEEFLELFRNKGFKLVKQKLDSK